MKHIVEGKCHCQYHPVLQLYTSVPKVKFEIISFYSNLWAKALCSDWLSKTGTLYLVSVSNSPESYFNLYLYGKFGIDKILRKFITLSK